MKPAEIRSMVTLRKPSWRQVDRSLGRCVTIDDLQRAAHRHWPKGVAGYVDGGADAEVTLRRNRSAFEAFELHPAILRDVGDVDMSTEVLGAASSLPFALAPTGYTQLMHADGETAVVRAAAAAGIAYTLSTMSTTSIEDVAQAASYDRSTQHDLWFQLYVWRDRTLMLDLMQRAADSGYRVLMLTVDTPVTGLRVQDAHNGFTIPPQLTASTMFDMARHPRWCAGMLGGPPVTFANIPGHEMSPSGVMAFAAEQFDPSVTWDDLAMIREQWRGPLVVKGLLRPEDVERAADLGVDAVVLSNHGGRQLDQTCAPIDVLPAARDAVGDRIELFVDSGMRRGTDVAIALARGADACLVGRPYLYGLGAGGQQGVSAAIGMLGDELRRTMQLLGVNSIAQLRREGNRLVRGPLTTQPSTKGLPR